MNTRRLILAGPLVIACVAGMSAGSGAAAAGAGRCPSASVDTRGWQLTRSFEFGVELLHPANYRRKFWEVRSPGYPPTIDLLRDGKPAWYVELRLLPADSMPPFLPTVHARTLRCTIRMGSGDAEALLERVAKTTLPTERDSFYLIRFRVPRSDGRSVIAFRASSIDSTRYVEQIAIAQSLRLVGLGAPAK